MTHSQPVRTRQTRRASLPTLAVLVGLGLLLLASAAGATSWVRVADDDLVHQAPLIVEATMDDFVAAPDARLPSRDYLATVTRVVKGSWEVDEAGSSNLRIRTLGGERADGSLLVTWDVPVFHRGERALLFLKPGRDGVYRFLHIFQGAFHVVEEGGRDVAYRNLSDGEFPGGKVLPAERGRDLERFVDWIRSVETNGKVAASSYRTELAPEALRALTEQRPEAHDKYTLIIGGGTGFRWRDFDTGGRIRVHAHQDGQPGLAGGGFAETQAAIAAWVNDGNSQILYRYGGMTSADGGFDRLDGFNTILFDDLGETGDFDSDFSCAIGGVIAKGGPSGVFPGSNHVQNGQVFRHTGEADVITNKGTDCYLDDRRTAAEVFTHELGHTLGFGHSCGDDGSPSCFSSTVLNDAIMRASAHNDGRGARLGTDDRAVANFVYGNLLAPPDAPTGLSAQAMDDFTVALAWNDQSNNESGFTIERRLGNSGTFSEVGSTGANATSFEDVTTASGTTYSYRVRAFNGAGFSGFSNSVQASVPGAMPPANLTATALSDEEIQIAWDDVTDGETGFEIEVRGAGGYALAATVPANTTQTVLDGLLAETEYDVRVRSIGDGATSSGVVASATTLGFVPGACSEDDTAICINKERFRVAVRWRDFKNDTARGQVVPVGSADSGLFWFFSEDNWELLIKVLDGCGLTESTWVFAAATTDVEYTLQVIDTWTGEQVSWFNPLGNAAAAITDIGAFQTCDAVPPPGTVTIGDPTATSSADLGREIEDFFARAGFEPGAARDEQPARSTARPTVPRTHGCTPSDTLLCLNDDRFQVEATWTDFAGKTGAAQVVPFGSADSGLFWFFGADNWEMLIKVLDGCPINERYWVFAAATTNVEYTLTVTDTLNDLAVVYRNELGKSSPAINDTGAFQTCP